MSFNLRFLCAASSVLLSLFFSPKVLCQNPYRLTDSTIIHRLDTYAEIFVDNTDAIQISDVIRPDFQKRFYPSKGHFTFGYLKSTIWLKIVTKTSSPKTQWYLEIPAPFLEYVDFYQEGAEDKWHHSRTGY